MLDVFSKEKSTRQIIKIEVANLCDRVRYENLEKIFLSCSNLEP